MSVLNSFLVATVVSTKGLKGEVKLKCFLQNLNLLQNATLTCNLNNTYVVKSFYVHKNLVIAKLQNINSIEQAQQLIGLNLYLPKSALPKLNNNNEYYAIDLINSTVLNSNLQAIGTVSGVQNYGAGDILQITLTNLTTKMLSFNNNSIINVDLQNNTITINAQYLL